MTPEPEILRENTSIECWLIECPDRCAATSCTSNHGGTGWRISTELAGQLSYPAAMELFEAYADKHPESGPYRLVQYSFVTATERVIFQRPDKEA